MTLEPRIEKMNVVDALKNFEDLLDRVQDSNVGTEKDGELLAVVVSYDYFNQTMAIKDELKKRIDEGQ